MAWLELLIALLVGLGGGWLAYRSSRRWATEERRRVQRAVPTHATVLHVHRGAMRHHRDGVPLRLRLEVEPPSYQGPNRTVEVGWEVPEDRVGEVAVGRRLEVKVDRYDERRIYPVIAGAEWWDTEPA
ncbi:MAG: hypothetical protein IT200_02715 [Thermoleophilia bacterium]|nr:hypothetical protein [Thermoleophilia bacterium]